MSDKKYVYKLSALAEYKSLEAYFERMAAKGWLIEKIGAWMTFRRVAPKALTFNVAVMTPKTMLDWPDKDETMTYDEFCESVGWQLAVESQVYRVYYRPAETEGPPIYSDEEDVYKALRKLFFRSEFVIMLLPFMYLVQFWATWPSEGHTVFHSNINIFSKLVPLFLWVIFWAMSLPSFCWVMVNGRRLSAGKPMVHFSPTWVRYKNAVIHGIMAIYFGLLVYAIVYDPYNSMPKGIVVTVMGTTLMMFVVVMLYKWFIQKKPYRLWVKVTLLVLISVVLGIGMVTATFTVIGSGMLGIDSHKPIAPEVERLTLAEMGAEGPTELEWLQVNTSLLVPLSYSYKEAIGEGETYEVLWVEYQKIRTKGLRDWLVARVLEKERERYAERYLYRPEVENYIFEVSVAEGHNVQVYNLSPWKEKIMVVTEEAFYLVDYTKPLEGENLERALEGLLD